MNAAPPGGLDALEIVSSKEFTIDNDLDTLFVIWATSMVLFMQVGFLLLEFGHVQPKNSRTVIMKNTLDNAFGILAWFLLGNALSGGPYGKGNGYIGTAWSQTVKQWVSVEEVPPEVLGTISSHPDALWSFYFAFASSAATIVSGAIAERAQLRAHLVLSVCMCGVIYPIAAYWVWGNDGWLSGLSGNAVFDVGVIDVAGGSVVHVLGGTAALVSAYILGPRTGCPPHTGASSPRRSDGSPKNSRARYRTGGTVRIRADQDKDVVIFNAARPAARAMIALGAFIMWFTWYGFNIGSLGGISGRSGVAAHAMLITTLAGMSGAVTSVVCTKFTSCFSFTISTTCNGMVAGLVASAGMCAIVPAWAAILGGAGAAVLAQAMAHLCPLIGIDDPVNAGPTHFAGGVTGMLCVALFSERSLLEAYLFQGAEKAAPDVGLVFGGSGRLLAVQLLGVVVIATWTAIVTGSLMMLMKVTGTLRQSLEVEVLGMDEQLFEEQQRDERLAFKVIQHVRAAEEREQGRKKFAFSCLKDSTTDGDIHPLQHAALDRRIAALSAAAPHSRLSLSMSSSNSCNTYSTGTGALAVSAQCLSPPHSPAATSPRASPPSGPPSGTAPLSPGAAAAASTAATAAGGAAGVAAAVAAAVTAAGSAANAPTAAPHASRFMGARSSSADTGGGAQPPPLPPRPSPLGTQLSSPHAAFRGIGATASGAAAGSMLTPPTRSHSFPLKERLWHGNQTQTFTNNSPTLRTLRPSSTSFRDVSSAHPPHISSIITAGSTPHTQSEPRSAMGLKLWHYSQRSQTLHSPSGVPPSSTPAPDTIPNATKPSHIMHNSAAGSLASSSSARLLSNVEAVAACSRPPVSCFQNILEGSSESRTSSGSFVSRSDTSTGSSARVALSSPNAQGDQSELTFAEDLTHSSRSVSLGGGRSSSSPPSPPPAKFSSSANLRPVASLPAPTQASRGAPWAMSDGCKATQYTTTATTSASVRTLQESRSGESAKNSDSQPFSLQMFAHTTETITETPDTVHGSSHRASAFTEGSKGLPGHEVHAQPESISLCLPPEPPAATVSTGASAQYNHAHMHEVYASAPRQPQKTAQEDRFMHWRTQTHDKVEGDDLREGGVRGGARRGALRVASNLKHSNSLSSAHSCDQKKLPGVQNVHCMQRSDSKRSPTDAQSKFQDALMGSPLENEDDASLRVLRPPSSMMPTSATAGVAAQSNTIAGGLERRGQTSAAKCQIIPPSPHHHHHHRHCAKFSDHYNRKEVQSFGSNATTSCCSAVSGHQAGSKGSAASVERVTIRRMHASPTATSAPETTSSSLELTGARTLRVRYAASALSTVAPPLTVSRVSIGSVLGAEGRRRSGCDSSYALNCSNSGTFGKVLERGVSSEERPERRQKVAEAKIKRQVQPWAGAATLPIAPFQSSSGEESGTEAHERSEESDDTARSDALTLKGLALSHRAQLRMMWERAVPPQPSAAEPAAAAGGGGGGSCYDCTTTATKPSTAPTPDLYPGVNPPFAVSPGGTRPPSSDHSLALSGSPSSGTYSGKAARLDAPTSQPPSSLSEVHTQLHTEVHSGSPPDAQRSAASSDVSSDSVNFPKVSVNSHDPQARTSPLGHTPLDLSSDVLRPSSLTSTACDSQSSRSLGPASLTRTSLLDWSRSSTTPTTIIFGSARAAGMHVPPVATSATTPVDALKLPLHASKDEDSLEGAASMPLTKPQGFAEVKTAGRGILADAYMFRRERSTRALAAPDLAHIPQQKRNTAHTISKHYPAQLPSTDSGSLEAVVATLEDDEEASGSVHAVREAHAARQHMPKRRGPLLQPMPASKRAPPSPQTSPLDNPQPPTARDVPSSHSERTESRAPEEGSIRSTRMHGASPPTPQPPSPARGMDTSLTQPVTASPDTNADSIAPGVSAGGGLISPISDSTPLGVDAAAGASMVSEPAVLANPQNLQNRENLPEQGRSTDSPPAKYEPESAREQDSPKSVRPDPADSSTEASGRVRQSKRHVVSSGSMFSSSSKRQAESGGNDSDKGDSSIQYGSSSSGNMASVAEAAMTSGSAVPNHAQISPPKGGDLAAELADYHRSDPPAGSGAINTPPTPESNMHEGNASNIATDSTGGGNPEGGLVALCTLPQAISGDLGPIWADSGHSSQLAAPSVPRGGPGYVIHRPDTSQNSASLANSSDVSGSIGGGSATLGISGFLGGRGGVRNLSRNRSRGGISVGSPVSRGLRRPGGGSSTMLGAGGDTQAHAQPSMHAHAFTDMNRNLDAQEFTADPAANFAVGTGVGTHGGNGGHVSVEGVQHWEYIAESTSESGERTNTDSENLSVRTPLGRGGTGSLEAPYALEATLENGTDSNSLGPALHQEPSAVSSGTESSAGDFPEPAARNIFKPVHAQVQQLTPASLLAPAARAAPAHHAQHAAARGSSEDSVSAVGAAVATSAELAAQQAPQVHAPAASPPTRRNAAAMHRRMHGSPKNLEEAMHAISSGEDSLTLME